MTHDDGQEGVPPHPRSALLSEEGEGRLLEVLSDVRRLGFAEAWAEVDPTMAAGQPRIPRRIGDLGSGGGVPGLVLAMATDAHLVLVDNKTKRTDWLSDATWRLGVEDRVTVISRPAEEVGQDPEWRGTCDVVVARWWWSASRRRSATGGWGWHRLSSATTRCA